MLSSLLLVLMLAGPDNNVEWDGISHIAYLDRRPLCPVNGETFTVYFQAYKNDLTSARVVLNNGGTTYVDATYDHDRGPYAVWKATIPAMVGTSLSYYIELTDGSDTDYYSVGGMSDNPPVDGGFVVDKTTLSHAPLGATPATGGVVFRVWAPNATQAWVKGEFNAWGTTAPMTKTGSYFAAYVAGATAGQQYKYFFNPGGIWKADARAARLNPTDNYNGYVINPLAFAWTDGNWQPPAFGDMLIYELHVGTFSGYHDPVASGSIPGTYRDVAAHAADLQDLGINMVELMPYTEFPTDYSMGYNPVNPWSPEWKLGTPDDFRYMVNALHAHGVGVIADIVWNHVSPTDNYLWNYDSTSAQIYFKVPDVQTPWGSQYDFSRAEVRDYLVQSAMTWIDQSHIDGFRMDATLYMDNTQTSDGYAVMQTFNSAINNRAVDRIAIAEQLPNDPNITKPTNLGGVGFDAQWHDNWVDNLRAAVFAAASGDPSMSSLASALNGNGSFLYGTNLLRYFESHDEAAPASGGDRAVNVIDTTAPHDDLYAKGRTKLAQGLTFLVPGVPMILMGNEWLESIDVGGGNSGGADRIDWAKKTTYANIYHYYKDLFALRKANACFKGNAGWQVTHVNDTANVIAFQRWDGAGNAALVVASLNNSNMSGYRLGFPQAGTWTEALNSQSSLYDGNNFGNGGQITTTAVAYDGFAQSATLNLPQMGLLVFTSSPPAPCPGDLTGDRLVDLSDLAIVLANYGLSGTATPAQGDLTGDHNVDLSDISLILSLYGQTCP